MHVCLFTIPKPTQTDRHTPGPTAARVVCMPPDMAGHGTPALLLRCGGRRGHTTRRTREPLRGRGARGGGRAADRWDTHTPHPNPRSHRVNLADHNLGPPYFRHDVHAFIPAPRWRILALCLKWARPRLWGTPSIYTTLPTSTRGASSKPQTNPSSLSPSADRTLESR